VAPGSPELGREGENPRRTQWQGGGHKSEGREGRTAERRSRAGQSNSGEES
jgi:hypothetical protein